MIKKALSILFTLTLLTTFFAQGKEVSISGVIENGAGEVIKLNKFVNNQQVTIDSCEINKKGKYKLSTTVQEKEFFSVMLAADAYALVILDSATTDKKVLLNGDAKNFVNSYTVKGNKDAANIAEFTKDVYRFQETKKALNKKLYTKGISIDERSAIQTSMDSLSQNFLTIRDQYIEENFKSPAVIVAVGYLRPIDDVDQLRKIEAGLKETMPESEYYIGVKTQLAQVETQIKIQEEQLKKQQEMEARTAVGAVAPELNFKSPTGEVITLESLRGNYVLIDFWASWCKPCRMENPNVVKMYNKYKEDGFTVYSVSLDKNKSSWENAIVQDGLIWPNHVSDLKQWQTEATKIYGFSGIPYTVLIGPEGKIIAKKLRGQALENKLEEIFGH
ncbi:TlpA disulfide reductase family protein [Parvicella tangerina]|uniref:Thiol-disulfide oxidoreductase ResA n=1 Tax=Parvicella tangerina TaxID=2829795 RepID=A0A916JK96_9FLAO|nr:TlpA disulfide reductase family protein [Parvicella tangerina]CAG5077971.1 Thiol-disulfide oxidoreductase ResA [Parvicella tangerina]